MSDIQQCQLCGADLVAGGSDINAELAKRDAEIERLKEAIRQHKLNVWGVTVCHEEDKKLYEVIGE